MINLKAFLLAVCASVLCFPCAGFSAGAAQPTPLGELVGSVAKMSDGKQIALYRHCATVTRSKAEVGPYESAGEWRWDTYQLTITTADGKSTEVVWKVARTMAVVDIARLSYGMRVLDARCEANALTVLFSDDGAVLRHYFVRSPEGAWSRSELGVVPYPEQPALDRIVVRGQILADRTVQLDYKNGDMERWQFQPTPGHVPEMVDHNDLKVTYGDLGEAAASGLFRVRQ